MELGENALVVLLHNVFRDTFHTEDFDVKACAIGKGIVDGSKVFLVHLIHVHVQA